MKQLNFNEFRKNGVEFKIDDIVYKINFIPYLIEKEIFQNMENVSSLLENGLKNLTDELEEMINNWLWQLLSHKKNTNEITQETFNDISLTERLVLLTGVVQYVSARMGNMFETMNDGEQKKKEIVTTPTA
jgi:hypothetical protein